MTVNSEVERWLQMGHACAATAGHCAGTRLRSRKPNRHSDHGSTGAGPAALAAAELFDVGVLSTGKGVEPLAEDSRK